MIYPEGPEALNNWYEKITTLVNYSEGRYSQSEILKMLPWELTVYYGKYSDYLDKIKEG